MQNQSSSHVTRMPETETLDIGGFPNSLVWSDAAHQILETGVGAQRFKAGIILEIHKPS